MAARLRAASDANSRERFRMKENNRARVLWKDAPAAWLVELANGSFVFEYDSAENEPVSITLPNNADKPALFQDMPSFFEGLVPEGWLLDVVRRNWKVSPNDKLAILLIAGRDCPGAASVIHSSQIETKTSSFPSDASLLEPKPLERTNTIGRCLMCGRICTQAQWYHEDCAAILFESKTPQIPRIDSEAIEDIARQHLSQQRILTGVQKKLSLGLAADGEKKRLTLFGSGNLAGYILKPESSDYEASLARNEHATMLLASAMGFRTPPFALMPLANGELAYIVRRFDRVQGKKIPCEDMAQILGRTRDERAKYTLSLEAVSKALQTYSCAPAEDLVDLFRLALFSFLVGNSDMHLKNIAILGNANERRLSPVYDLLNTKICMPDDSEDCAISMAGTKNYVTWETFLEFATSVGIPARIAKAHIRSTKTAAGKLIRLLETNSFLSEKDLAKFQLTIRRAASKLE
jgi:serine/threonine-protein kinase HipA